MYAISITEEELTKYGILNQLQHITWLSYVDNHEVTESKISIEEIEDYLDTFCDDLLTITLCGFEVECCPIHLHFDDEDENLLKGWLLVIADKYLVSTVKSELGEILTREKLFPKHVDF